MKQKLHRSSYLKIALLMFVSTS